MGTQVATRASFAMHCAAWCTVLLHAVPGSQALASGYLPGGGAVGITPLALADHRRETGQSFNLADGGSIPSPEREVGSMQGSTLEVPDLACPPGARSYIRRQASSAASSAPEPARVGAAEGRRGVELHPGAGSALSASVKPRKVGDRVHRRQSDPALLQLFELPSSGGAARKDGKVIRRVAFWGDSHLAAGFFVEELVRQLALRGIQAGTSFLPPYMPRSGVRMDLRAFCLGEGWRFRAVYTSEDEVDTGPALAEMRGGLGLAAPLRQVQGPAAGAESRPPEGARPSDARRQDPELPDQGPPDTGGRDTGPPDSGGQGIGPPDAGGRDIGPPDAGGGPFLSLDLRSADRRSDVRGLKMLYRALAFPLVVAVSVDSEPERLIRLDQRDPSNAPNTPTTPGAPNAPNAVGSADLRRDDGGMLSTLAIRVVSGELAVQGFRVERSSPAALTIDTLAFPGATVKGWALANPEVLGVLQREDPYDAVVLAYGTNEAAGAFDPSRYTTLLHQALRTLRAVHPGVPCLLVGAPDRGVHQSATGPSRAKGAPPTTRPQRNQRLRFALVHKQVNAIQAHVGALYGCRNWDWQLAMGGVGSAYRWARATPPLMARDLVHLTAEGYRESAGSLARHIGWAAAPARR